MKSGFLTLSGLSSLKCSYNKCLPDRTPGCGGSRDTQNRCKWTSAGGRDRCGTICLSAVAVAKSIRAEVGLSARHPHQTKAGTLLGASEIEGQYDLVVECAGTESALNQAVELCRPQGKLLLLGTYWDGTSLPLIAAMMKEITIIPSYMYAAGNAGRDFDIAATLLAGNTKIPEALITHRFPLTEIPQAFSVARDRKAGAIKVVLEP